MRTILAVMLMLALSFAVGGCVEVNTIPTHVEAGDNVEDLKIDSNEVPTPGVK